MRFTEVAADAFEKIALNAGVMLSEFDPANVPDKATMKANIVAATSGGLQFTATPTYTDFGEDIDNVPTNTKELKKADRFEVTLGGTAVTTDAAFIKRLIGPADVSVTSTLATITPRADLLQSDFADIWWVGDYSDKNGATKGGFIAIKIIDALSTGGFQIQSTDNGKVTFAFTFTGHYSMADVQNVPFRVYVQAGEDEPSQSAGGQTPGQTGGQTGGQGGN